MFPPGVDFLRQIEDEMSLVSLKEELKELIIAAMNLLDQAVQVVDRMTLLAALISLLFFLLATSLIYVILWKQRAHLDLVLGN
jgi:hypothetical protein